LAAFPYIWNEIKFSIAYESDFGVVATPCEDCRGRSRGTKMKQVRVFRELLHRLGDQLEVREEPAVFFRINSNTCWTPSVRYLVHSKASGRVNKSTDRKTAGGLNAEPDRVCFPSNAR